VRLREVAERHYEAVVLLQNVKATRDQTSKRRESRCPPRRNAGDLKKKGIGACHVPVYRTYAVKDLTIRPPSPDSREELQALAAETQTQHSG